MLNSEMAGIPALSVESVIDTLSSTFISTVRAGLSPKMLPSVMLWGPPGIGKSQAVRQIAKRIERECGKRCTVTDVRLLLFNPIDLRGIPTASADKTLAIWLKPKIFQMDESDRVVNILFLDEISAAPQSVQAAAYQITLDRVVGEHKLPDNCIVIAAGNRVTDKSVAFKMPKALANRLCHIEMMGGTESWMRWAIGAGVDERVIGFISFRGDYLMRFDGTNDELAFATPRSWEMVSNVLKLPGASVEGSYPLIAGCVGSAVALEFRSWCKIFDTLPDVPSIFAGRVSKVPKDTDALYALISSMTVYARENKDKEALIANSIRYAMGMPPDFSAVLLKNYMAIEPGYRDKLMRIPEFSRWLNTKGRLLNGSV